MGVKDLWSILTPYAERKPISELRGKTIAIDLAGWVCESLNVVDYTVHPRHHLKNLFFRACYLIWADITPVFILEGVPPKLKSQIMEKRLEIKFRGVKPKCTQSKPDFQMPMGDKGRARFHQVLKQCENLLEAMGLQCAQAPGEAEAYCAFLNSRGIVDGVISQDSDCFAYGALRVYRNFSISSQGALTAQGGAVDIYDMNNICSKMDFGQNKVIVMALLCGCDYCPDGIGGVGRDSVLKLFNNYKNYEILKRISSWRSEDYKYSALEMRVNDKTTCSNCGHIGRTQSHTKNGCGVCCTNSGCDENLWKDERLALKAVLDVRKKALSNPCFPNKEIIEEFLKQPKEVPELQLQWRQPNIIKFIKQVGHLLEWTEIYCFQKFFPILTRWKVLNNLKDLSSDANYITPKKVIKKRVVKGVSSLELLWFDETGFFKGLIPDSQLKDYLDNNPDGLQRIWSTVEPFDKVKIAYPTLVESFVQSKEKAGKAIKKSTKKVKLKVDKPSPAFENLDDLIGATSAIALNPKVKRIQMINKFFNQKPNKAIEDYKVESLQCSTPITKTLPCELESDIDEDVFDMSDIVNGIVSRSRNSFTLTTLKGKHLCYETIKQDALFDKTFANNTNRSFDDFGIPSEKRSLSNSFFKSTYKEAKRMSLDDSFDVLVKKGVCRNFNNIKEK